MEHAPGSAAPEASGPPVSQRPAALALLQAQAIACGHLSVAVPFTWARLVVDEFSVSPAPNAPAWLVGAANVEGRIVPVIDLPAWLDESAAQSVDRHSRLLVGGEGEHRFGLLFQGLPAMVRYAPGSHEDHDEADGLAPFVIATAIAGGQSASRHRVIDVAALGESWVGELAV